MSELISGKEALIALANGEEVQHFNKKMAALGIVKDSEWGECGALCADDFLMENGIWAFRLKPRTITLNTEIPVTFNPKDGDVVFVLDNANPDGFSSFVFDSDFFTINFGAWRTEAEIKQVVAALREVFK